MIVLHVKKKSFDKILIKNIVLCRYICYSTFCIWWSFGKIKNI